MRPLARPALAAALAVLALALVPACSGTLGEIATQNPVPGVNEGEWEAVRNLATRRARLYDRFSHRATATATYLGRPEREAKVERLAVWLGWTAEEKARALQAELEEVEKFDDFLVAVYTSDRRANDLDAKRSIWRIALQVDGGDRITKDVTALELDATLANLYPYVSPFDTVYRVRFTRAPGAPLTGRTFGLELASALGRLPMKFGDGAVGPNRPAGTPLTD